MQKHLFLLLLFLTGFCFTTSAQEDLLKLLHSQDSIAEPEDLTVRHTFRTSRVVNAPTPETLNQRQLDFRVTHRFGNVAGEDNGINNFFGLDEASNIRISFDYGISDRLMVGFGRSKVRALLDGFVKYRLLRQTIDNKMPISVTLMGIAGYNSKRSPEKSIDRLSYVTQAIIARKITNKLSVTAVPVLLHRNLVDFHDENNTFALGAGARYSFSRNFAVLVDYYHIFSEYQRDQNFAAPLGIGVEIDTGGHIFHMNFTNATGIMENQFLAETRDSWGDGHFKWGFNISRIFKF